MSHVPYRRLPDARLEMWLPPVIVSGLLWWISPNSISVREGILATVLLIVPWCAYGRWQRAGQTRIPLFALLALAYWAAFALPLFLSDAPLDPRGDRFEPSTIEDVLAMTVLGVAATGVGMKLRISPIKSAMLPDVSDTPRTWHYLYCVMIAGTLLSLKEDWSILGSGGRQLIATLSGEVPIAICAMLAAKQLQGTATRSNRIALAAFVASRVLIGIASGWMGTVVFMGVILGLVRLAKYRRIPVAAIAVIIPVVLFLQVGKNEFRQTYWVQGRSGGVIDKTEYWLRASFDRWNSVLRKDDREGARSLASQSIDRVALLSQAAEVVASTPKRVPFQNGKSYTYLAATLIPRAVWPDKPSVNEANRFYQVAYGLTSQENLDDVSISVGCLAEAFMNFGWWGVPVIMFALGLTIGFFEHTLLAGDSGMLFGGIGMAMVGGLLGIQAQAAAYVGGMLQQIGVIFLVALPFLYRRRAQHGRKLPVQAAI